MMELDWKDVEDIPPAAGQPVWVYFGGNEVRLAKLILENNEWILIGVIDTEQIFDRIKLQAWAPFIFPPVPRRVWSTT